MVDMVLSGRRCKVRLGLRLGDNRMRYEGDRSMKELNVG
jgi:hypothetical protein